jgi:hypothetical protein
MRRLLLILSLLALLAPAAAFALRGQPGDGTLVIENGRGVVQVTARGGLIGRADSARITIEDPNPNDGTVIISGAVRAHDLSDTKTVYTGTDIRFRITSGFFRIKVVGVGINLGAVARGSVIIQGVGGPDDGTYAFDNDAPQSLPDVTTRFFLGSNGG